MLFTNEKYGYFAKDPAVVKLDGKYYLYHTIHNHVMGKFGLGIAVSENLENWEICGEISPDAEYEKNGLCAAGAIVIDGIIHLFYQTYGNGKNDAICHATSADGIHFVRDSSNPVFHPTNDWCCERAIDADVVIFNSRLFMYFATRDHAFKIQKIGGAYADLNSDFSRAAWTQIGCQAILTPEFEWEGECIEASATVVNDGKIYMFYGGAYNCCPQQIGCAVSSDGVHFDKIFTQPFLKNGASGEWNSSESGHPYVFEDDDGKIYLFYQGSPDMGKTWYISKKEITFKDGVPLFTTTCSI